MLDYDGRVISKLTSVAFSFRLQPSNTSIRYFAQKWACPIYGSGYVNTCAKMHRYIIFIKHLYNDKLGNWKMRKKHAIIPLNILKGY